MVNKKYLPIFLIWMLSLSAICNGQFVEVNVDLDMRRLSEGNRQLFNTMEEDMKQYFLNTQFSQDVADLKMNIDIRLVLESVFQGGSQTTINAQAIFVNKEVQPDGSMKTMDQYYYAKGIQFPYSNGKKIIYTTSFDPLASFLDYYAYMFIATELDTWDYMGGTSFFNRAVELAHRGKNSDWPKGWDDRWKKARKIKNNQDLRSMRFSYFEAWYVYKYAEEPNINVIEDIMLTFYGGLKEIDKKLGSNKETLKFLGTYHVRIAELLAALKIWGCLELLRDYDQHNKKVYASYLKN